MSVISSEKIMRSIRHNLSLANPCWLFQITLLSFVCWERTSKRIYFITSPGTEVTLIGLNLNFPHCFFMHGLYSSHKASPYFHLLCTSFSWSSSVRSSMFTLASLLPCLPDFLHMEMKCFCALMKLPWRPTSSPGHLYSPEQFPQRKWRGQDLPFWSSSL